MESGKGLSDIHVRNERQSIHWRIGCYRSFILALIDTLTHTGRERKTERGGARKEGYRERGGGREKDRQGRHETPFKCITM